MLKPISALTCRAGRKNKQIPILPWLLDCYAATADWLSHKQTPFLMNMNERVRATFSAEVSPSRLLALDRQTCMNSNYVSPFDGELKMLCTSDNWRRYSYLLQWVCVSFGMGVFGWFNFSLQLVLKAETRYYSAETVCRSASCLRLSVYYQEIVLHLKYS